MINTTISIFHRNVAQVPGAFTVITLPVWKLPPPRAETGLNPVAVAVISLSSCCTRTLVATAAVIVDSAY
jgi:hypothetical protein